MLKRAWLLIVLAVLGGIVVIGVVVFTLNASLGAFVEKTNELDEVQTEQSVRAAVASAMEGLVGLVTDNAFWSVAYDHVNDELDANWLYETWGTTAESGTNYDGIVILNPDGSVWWGHGNNLNFGTPESRIFSARLAMDGIILPDRDEAIVKGIVDLGGQFALVAAERVRPTEGDPARPSPSNRFLLMYKLINAKLLKNLSTLFDIDQLMINKNPVRGSTGVDLKSADGERVGFLTWQPRRPGEDAAQVVQPKINLILMVVCVLIIAFIGALLFGLRRLAHRDRLLHVALRTDTLTGLPNRTAITDALDKLLLGKGNDNLSLTFMNIDGFKEVNDTYGHEVGNLLLQAVAKRLQSCISQGILVFRIGGDEFALVDSPAVSLDTAIHAATRILERFKAPIEIEGRLIQVDLKMGITAVSGEAIEVDELLRRADVAMYTAKNRAEDLSETRADNRTRNRIVVFEAGLDEDRRQAAELKEELHLAIKRNEFTVAYQPIVDARSHTLQSVEALLRWSGRPAGPLPPDVFIPIAETSGMIHQMGMHVLSQACADWMSEPDVRVSVNVSPVQFHDPAFEANVERVLAATGFPAGRLDLEITEGYLIDKPARAKEVMNNLRSLGIGIVLDDFGTGYTSIGYLREYRFDRIKIDKSLAGRVDRDPEAAVMVSGTVAIANGLGMSVTAEGVETSDQARLLGLAGCHHLQGYLFGRPTAINDFQALVKLGRFPSVARASGWNALKCQDPAA